MCLRRTHSHPAPHVLAPREWCWHVSGDLLIRGSADQIVLVIQGEWNEANAPALQRHRSDLNHVRTVSGTRKCYTSGSVGGGGATGRAATSRGAERRA